MSVYDSRGMKNQRYVGKIRGGTSIVKRHVGTGSIKPQLGDTKTRRPKATFLQWFESSCTSLPETYENSNYILLRIPIEISNSAHGEKAIAVAEAPLSSILPLSPAATTRLQSSRLIQPPRPARAKKQPIDYAALQQTYARMLIDRPFSNLAELARHLGVSRVWVSRVLKGMRRKTD